MSVVQRNLTLWLLLLSSISALQAAVNDSIARHWGAEVGFLPSWEVPFDMYERQWLRKRYTSTIRAEIGRTALPQDSDHYAADFGYPTLSYGVALHLSQITMGRASTGYESPLGNAVSGYIKFQRPIFRTAHWSASYMLGGGVGYHHRKYNPNTDPDNELIGSRWGIYFTAGAHLTYRFASDWGVRFGAEYFHHSNGALNRPNKGSNRVGGAISLVYMPQYEVILRTGNAPKQHFPHYFYITAMLGLGGKTLQEEWQYNRFQTNASNPRYRTTRFHVNPVYECQVAFMYRYARRWASGIGIDAAYLDLSRQPAFGDGHARQYDRWSVGVAAQHEVFYHRLSLAMSLGWYLHRDKLLRTNELEQPYYEHIGLFYTFPSLHRLKIGISVKAHKTKADYTSLQVSVPLFLSKGR